MRLDDVGRFTIAAGRALERLGQERFKPYGLTVSDVAPLILLAELGPMTPKELLESSILLTSAPVVSHSINRLERAGLIARRPNQEDGRSAVIEITENGLRLEGDLYAQVMDIQDGFFSPLNDEEKGVFANLLGRCLANYLGLAPDTPMLALDPDEVV